jgi:hypothetical protein
MVATVSIPRVLLGLQMMFKSMAIGLIFAGGIAWMVWESTATGMCENTLVSSLRSPTGVSRAILFERSCGATTDFSTQISVIGEGESVVGGGNVFVATTSDSASIVGEWGGPYAELEWIDDQILLISFDASAEVFLEEEEHDGVLVRYQRTK